MNGFTTNPQIKDSDLDILIKEAQNGVKQIPITAPDGTESYIILEVSKVKKGWFKVLVDIIPCAWDITEDGQQVFPELINRLPDKEDRRNAFCGKRVLEVETRETGEGLILAAILIFLGQGKYLERIRI
jgi:hypothetical protein